jgi:hypothetical protein
MKKNEEEREAKREERRQAAERRIHAASARKHIEYLEAQRGRKAVQVVKTAVGVEPIPYPRMKIRRGT